jgi:hypothetical protein
MFAFTLVYVRDAGENVYPVFDGVTVPDQP